MINWGEGLAEPLGPGRRGGGHSIVWEQPLGAVSRGVMGGGVSAAISGGGWPR